MAIASAIIGTPEYEEEQKRAKKERGIVSELLGVLGGLAEPAAGVIGSPIGRVEIQAPTFARDPTEPAPAETLGGPAPGGTSSSGSPSSSGPSDSSFNASGPNSDDPTAGDKHTDVQSAISRGDMEALGETASVPDTAIGLLDAALDMMGFGAFSGVPGAGMVAAQVAGDKSLGKQVASHERSEKERANAALGALSVADIEAALDAQTMGVSAPDAAASAAAAAASSGFGKDVSDAVNGFMDAVGGLFGGTSEGSSAGTSAGGSDFSGPDDSGGFPGDQIFTGDPFITSEDLFIMPLPGPDDGIAQLDIGELVMNKQAAGKLSPRARDRLASGNFNAKKLMEVLGGNR